MVAQKRIDRDMLLDTAEDLVLRHGPAGFTIDAVAKALGVTKGGVQYHFRSKDAFIQAMVDRWFEQYDRIFDDLTGGGEARPETTIAASLEALRTAGGAMNAKSATILTTLLQSRALDSLSGWYRATLDQVATDDEAGRVRRLQFLASEGAFLLRSLGLLPMTDGEWEETFRDIKALDPPARD